MDEALAYFLDLRLQLRGRPAATAIVDRCLLILARARDATPAELPALLAEVADLQAELLTRFGAKGPVVMH